jgi:hypothetical protein
LHRPNNHKELFNLRHAQLRNVVERIFGVAKNKFAILRDGTDFGERKQADLIIAFIVIFNFVRIFGGKDIQWDPMNWKDLNFDDVAEDADAAGESDEGDLGGHISSAERRNAEHRRDAIAHEMWNDYQAELRERAM